MDENVFFEVTYNSISIDIWERISGIRNGWNHWKLSFREFHRTEY